jgi:hypothetical protein
MSGSYFQPIKREFLNLSGGTVTGNTVFTQGLYANVLSGGTLYSGSTSLVDIFLTASDVSGTTLSEGANILLQQSGIDYNLSVVDSPSFNNIFFSGTAVGGNLSVLNLSGATIYSGDTNIYDIFSQTDYYTTGSTFNPGTKIATFNRNDGNTYTLNLSALTTADTYITGFTYIPNVITIKQNNNQADLQVSIDSFFGISISGITNRQIEINYNPTASTESTSLGSGILIQDGSGVAGTDVFFDVRGTGTTVSNRGFATNLYDIYLRESGTTNSPNGVRVITEFDELDGGTF